MRWPSGRAERAGCALAGAMVAAPFLALLYGPDAGLAVAVAALVTTAWLAHDAARRQPETDRRRFVLAAGVNAAFALVLGAVLIARRL